MYFIVYKEKFNGYFVKYKDKVSDTYSPNWYDAQKFKMLGAALSRLGINLDVNIDTIDKFIEYNLLDKSVYRDNLLSDILSEDRKVNLSFVYGRVDKIGSNGEFLGRADDEVLEYIEKKILKNSEHNKNLLKLFNSRLESINGKSNSYLIETKVDEDFWDGF